MKLLHLKLPLTIWYQNPDDTDDRLMRSFLPHGSCLHEPFIDPISVREDTNPGGVILVEYLPVEKKFFTLFH